MKEVTAGVEMPMSADELQKAKEGFLRHVCCSGEQSLSCALRDSYHSAVKQGRNAAVFYGNLRRGEFQKRVRVLLQEISCRYRCIENVISDDQHVEHIEELRRKLSDEFAVNLQNQSLRFGRAQKMLNLFLKHLWARNCIGTPPHCPFDRGILKALGIYTRWTHTVNIAEYEGWVLAARRNIEDGRYSSISEWELVEFARQHTT